MTCKVCQEPGQIQRHREIVFGDVELEITAPLCESCADQIPVKILEALQNPIVRSTLKVLGVKFDLDQGFAATT